METTIVRRPASFRLRADLLEGLKRNAARENRTLNNYVESVLLGVVYGEPNEETKAAIREAMNRKVYPAGELYSSSEELFKALNADTTQNEENISFGPIQERLQALPSSASKVNSTWKGD